MKDGFRENAFASDLQGLSGNAATRIFIGYRGSTDYERMRSRVISASHYAPSRTESIEGHPKATAANGCKQYYYEKRELLFYNVSKAKLHILPRVSKK